MQNNPLVSIIVRTKDRPKLLRKALGSISGQTYRPVEVVLVNDGGCDLDSEDLQWLLGEVALRYVRLENNMGRPHAGNVGIQNGSGKYLGFLDDDDELCPDHLETLVPLLEQLDYSVAYSDSYMVQKEYDPRALELTDASSEVVFTRDFDYDFLIFENYIPFMCLLFRRDAVIRTGMLDESLELYEDWDFLIRMGEHSPFYHVKKTTACYNQWSGDMQISQKNKDFLFVEESYQRVLSKHRDKITGRRIRNYISAFVGARARIKELDGRTKEMEVVLQGKDASLDSYRNAALALESGIRGLESQISEKDKRIGELDSIIAGLRSGIETLGATVKTREAFIDNLHSVIGTHEAAGRAKDSRILELEGGLRELESRIWNLETAVRDRDIAMQRIEDSRGWKALLAYYKVRDRAFPEGSRRRLFIKLCLMAARDPKAFFKGMSSQNIKKFIAQYKVLDPSVVESKVRMKTSLYSAGGNGGGAGTSAQATFSECEAAAFENEEVLPPPRERNRVLVIDRSLPAYDRDSGALRMFSLLGILRDLGCRVTFLPDDLLNPEPYASELQAMGIEVIYGNIDVEGFLKKNGGVFSFVIISRPEQTYKFIAMARAYAIYSSIIYDTVDLHWVRFERTGEVTKDEDYIGKAVEYKAMELFNAAAADVTFTVTPEEKRILENEIPGVRVEVVPNIHQPLVGQTPFNERRDLMFIGGFFHQPNEDAVFYFIREILPLIREKLGGVKFFVVGSDPSAAIQGLNSADIIVTGYVRDVSPYFNRCRVFVSPLRYGAGMKGKIGQSMSYGLPVVTTSVGAEGIGLVNGENALVADDPAEFAEAVIRLYEDELLWGRISRKAVEHIEQNYSTQALGKKIGSILEGLRAANVNG